MTTAWTTEQIIGLAPDAAAAKAGRGLASAQKWQLVGSSPAAVWGACKGSAAKPYQTIIDLAGPTFTCSCPSRKFPCKHGLGLFLLLATEPALFGGEPPAWATEWLTQRQQKQAAKAERAAAPVDAATLAKRAKDEAKRATQRSARVAAGLDDLDTWLRNLVRQGLAAAQPQPASFWEGPAARLVDAQAPGVARLVRELAGTPHSGDGWPARLLGQLGRLALLIAAYRRLDALPAATQADVRAVIGWTVEEAELAGPGVVDRWLVAGQRLAQEDHLSVERTWLLGERSGRVALALQFGVNGQATRSGLIVGTALDGAAIFYPSARPLRASLRDLGPAQPAHATPAGGHAGVAAALASYAAALAQQPWLERWPMLLAAATPARADGQWQLQDDQGAALPLAAGFEQPWELLAISGGAPVAVFAEWDGAALLPLTCWADGRCIRFGGAA